MAADLDRHVAPIGIQDMKRIMIHIRHGFLTFQMMLLPAYADFTYGRLRFSHEDQKHTLLDLCGLE